jgi:hypothetical protein
VEPRRAGGLGILDPRLLPHRLLASTPVLSRLIPSARPSQRKAFWAHLLRLIPEKSIGATGFEPAT